MIKERFRGFYSINFRAFLTSKRQMHSIASTECEAH